MFKSDSLFQAIDKGGKSLKLLNEKIENQFGETCAVLVLDSTGFTKTTQSEGIVFYLSIISKLRKIGEKIFKKNKAISYRGHADNLYAEFETVDSAVQAAFSIHTYFNENPVELNPAKNTFGVCIGIGYGKVLRSEHDGVYGNEMNLASKLGEDKAGKGDTLLTRAAYKSLTNREVFKINTKRIRVSGVSIPLYDLKEF